MRKYVVGCLAVLALGVSVMVVALPAQPPLEQGAPCKYGKIERNGKYECDCSVEDPIIRCCLEC
jgi:hypothetical protein